MGKQDTPSDKGQNPKDRAAAEREERLRKQLRANLQRRKAQARSRAAGDKDTTDEQ